MNRIEEMIKEMCPDGVRRVRLGEVCEVINGRAYRQSELLSEGKYRVLRVGNFFSNENWYYSDLELEDKYYCQKGDLLYAWSATFGPHMWKEDKTIYHYHIWKLDVSCCVNKKYLYYWLQSNNMLVQVSSEKHGATMAHLTKGLMENLQIPLPPLPIQQEIVKILDSFTALQQNLEDELKLRQKQYEHYREKIFTKEDCELVNLGEFASHQKEKNKNYITNDAYSITQNGLVPTKEFFKEKTHVTSSDTKGYYIVRENWFVYSPSRVDVGSISYLKVKGPVIVSPIDVVFSIDCEKCLPSYLLKYLLSHPGMRQLLKNREGVEGTGRRSLPFTAITHVQVPLPSIDRQLQITQTLDHFESLISNLKTEIELRKKQYEYYREKLLTF